MNSVTVSQKEICLKYKADFSASDNNLKVGISLSVINGVMPINGLRHQPEKDTTGWYIWAGQEMSQDEDFFVPMHLEHLQEICPLALKYLGLPAGWRFLITDDGYEDVWQDKSLLKI